MVRQHCDVVVEGMADFDRPAVNQDLRRHLARASPVLVDRTPVRPEIASMKTSRL